MRASIYIVFGNNDADLFRITSNAREFPQVLPRGEYFEETFDGRRVAVNHFDNIARALAAGSRTMLCSTGITMCSRSGRLGRRLRESGVDDGVPV